MEQPRLEEIRHHPLPALGRALQKAIPEILKQWRDEVTRVVPEFDGLTRKQLEHSLPVLLNQMAAALSSTRDESTDKLIQESPGHGETRYHQDFSLNQLLVEYNILRTIMLRVLTAELGRPLDLSESIALNQGVDIALRQSTVAFADHQRDALKVEAAAMTKFLSFLSHDLRGGLNGAVLMIEVLRRQLLKEAKFAEAVQDLDIVRRSILDTVSTMERFLHAEKLRLGRMPVKPGVIDVPELLAELKRSVSYQLSEQDVQMEIAVEPGMKIISDRQLLVLILQNLISNAVKYGRRGTVKLSAEPVAPDGSCTFAVIDQGPGIAPDKLEQLFAGYARGETYGQKGMGLGLFIARQAADLMGAKLWAESVPGRGSSFYVTVKASELPSEPADALAARKQ